MGTNKHEKNRAKKIIAAVILAGWAFVAIDIILWGLKLIVRKIEAAGETNSSAGLAALLVMMFVVTVGWTYSTLDKGED